MFIMKMPEFAAVNTNTHCVEWLEKGNKVERRIIRCHAELSIQPDSVHIEFPFNPAITTSNTTRMSQYCPITHSTAMHSAHILHFLCAQQRATHQKRPAAANKKRTCTRFSVRTSVQSQRSILFFIHVFYSGHFFPRIYFGRRASATSAHVARGKKPTNRRARPHLLIDTERAYAYSGDRANARHRKYAIPTVLFSFGCHWHRAEAQGQRASVARVFVLMVFSVSGMALYSSPAVIYDFRFFPISLCTYLLRPCTEYRIVISHILAAAVRNHLTESDRWAKSSHVSVQMRLCVCCALCACCRWWLINL